METFGDIIRNNRIKGDLPLRKVAAALDIDPSILSKIERGERNANRHLVSLASEFFSLNEDEMLTQFYSDEIARKIYLENKSDEILKVAESKIKYLRNKELHQTDLKFENE
jgi:transcriptional regulator with XRE-family HTH domain